MAVFRGSLVSAVLQYGCNLMVVLQCSGTILVVMQDGVMFFWLLQHAGDFVFGCIVVWW